MKETVDMFKDAAVLWYQRDATHLAASASYYAIFAVVPLIFLTLFTVSGFFGAQLAEDTLLTWGLAFDPQVVQLLVEAVNRLEATSGIGSVSFLGLSFLFLAIIIFFNTFAGGIHHLWNVAEVGILTLKKKTVHSFYCLVLLQVFVAVLIIAEFSIYQFVPAMLAPVILQLIYLTSLTVLFTIFYGILPVQSIPSLTSRWRGALIAAIGFVLTKQFVWFKIAIAPVPDLFGAAGIIVVLLLWIYFAISLIYFGAAFAFVHHNRSVPTILNN